MTLEDEQYYLLWVRTWREGNRICRELMPGEVYPAGPAGEAAVFLRRRLTREHPDRQYAVLTGRAIREYVEGYNRARTRSSGSAQRTLLPPVGARIEAE